MWCVFVCTSHGAYMKAEDNAFGSQFASSTIEFLGSSLGPLTLL